MSAKQQELEERIRKLERLLTGSTVQTTVTMSSNANLSALNAHIANKGNPHQVTPEQLGVGSEDSPTFANVTVDNLVTDGLVDGVDVSDHAADITIHNKMTVGTEEPSEPDAGDMWLDTN